MFAVEASRLAGVTREVAAKNGFSHVIEVSRTASRSWRYKCSTVFFRVLLLPDIRPVSGLVTLYSLRKKRDFDISYNIEMQKSRKLEGSRNFTV